MNDAKWYREFEAWMPFVLLVLFLLVSLFTLFRDGSMNPALQGILLGVIFILGMGWIPSKKKGG